MIIDDMQQTLDLLENIRYFFCNNKKHSNIKK